jgi:hypothetical protein
MFLIETGAISRLHGSKFGDGYFAWVMKSDACAFVRSDPFIFMDSRVARRNTAPSLKQPWNIDETVSTLVTYALIVNTLSIFDIRIEDPLDYVKFFPKRRVIHFGV